MRVRGDLQALLRRALVRPGGDAAEPRREEDGTVAARARADPQHVVRRAPHRGDLVRVGAVGDRLLPGVDRQHLTPLL